MTLEASFTKCQRLCSFQEHFPQRLLSVLRAPIPLHLYGNEDISCFVHTGLYHCWTQESKNNGVNNACCQCLVCLVEVASFKRRRRSFAFCLHCYPSELFHHSNFIHRIFIIIIVAIITIINRSSFLHCMGFVEYILVYPVPGVFQEYACIIRQPLSESHYSLISLVYLLWWSAQIDMTAE